MPPIVKTATPNSGDPGDIFTVQIFGDVLSRTIRVSFGLGVRTDPPKVINDGEVQVKVRIALDAASGPRDIVLFDPTGSGALMAGFTVF